jgi:predicted extracellular nuclease
MRKLSILLFLLFSFLNLCFSQQYQPSARNSLTVVFYNVENLYDNSNDPKTADDEFLPGNSKNWNDQKYQKKISDLAKVLSSINEKELPALIGLAEVENKKILEDLAYSTGLKKAKYGIIHYDSHDEKGLDVALLYDQDKIELLDSQAIPVSSGSDSRDVFSDILYTKCRIRGDNVYHIFVNHWPSRLPNEQDSEIKRIVTAIALRKEVDNILNSDNGAHIIIMGNFNDEPTNKSLFQILNASEKKKNVHYRDLYNLMFEAHNSGTDGSVFNNDTWQMFDQIIVSQSLFSKGTNYYISYGDGRIFKNELVLLKDPKSGITTINSTYKGDRYNNGVSDHLPVYVVLKRERK